MTSHSDHEEPQSKGKKITVAVIAAVVVLLARGEHGWVHVFFPSAFSFVFRAKNEFSFYVLGQMPHFYYLRIEKNGKEIRLGEADVLEVTYRDEFAVKSVVSDDLNERHTFVNIEGTGNEG